jgi:thiamine-phosphate diphosphorylase
LKSLPRIHAVTNNAVLDSPGFEGSARALLDTAAAAVHLRSSTATARSIAVLAGKLSQTGGSIFINDRVDIAAACKTPGIHLPSHGIPIARVREMLGVDVSIGKSTHSCTEVGAAFDEGADFVFLGPIWPTSSHPGNPGLGPEILETATSLGRVIGIGGVTVERSKICADAGAYGIAAIGAIWQSDNPSGVVAEMSLSFGPND